MWSKHAAFVQAAFFVLLIRFTRALVITPDMLISRMGLSFLSPVIIPLVERLS